LKEEIGNYCYKFKIIPRRAARDSRVAPFSVEKGGHWAPREAKDHRDPCSELLFSLIS